MYSNNNSAKMAVVTGAHDGIGRSIVKLILMHHPDWIVYLTSRDPGQGAEAVQHLSQEYKLKARYHQLDLENAESIRTFKSDLAKFHPRGIDVLVNNAAIFPNVGKLEDQFDFLGTTVIGQTYSFVSSNIRRTLKANYFGTLNVCTELFPLLSHEASVVMVSSRLAHFVYMNSTPKVQDQIKNSLTVEQISKLMNSFIDTDPADYESEGWLTKPPTTEVMPGVLLGELLPFGVSKLGLALLARAYQNEFRSKNYRVQVNACCPGLVHSDESHNLGGDLPPDQGADTIFYLTEQTRDGQHHGDFVAERKSIGFFTLSESDLKFFFK